MLALSTQLNTYLLLGAMLFGFGVFGLVKRPSLIGMLIAAELVLCGASVNFMAFNHFLAPDKTVGQIMTLFIMAIAAAEAAIAMSIIVAVYRNYKSVETQDLADLQG
ncbi:MAG: NADH-quinone oxidoreductase subunit NuoK [Desulfobulbaceae bacterium]|jgi:NADH:ubiquinone oxidoreductase subunit K|nr:NADH-quinone oxidoreductase subunit NuoK [Desulfobulbaceae bacterium]